MSIGHNVVSRFSNNLDKVNDMQEADSPDLDVKPFNSGEAFRNMRPRDRRRFMKNRREYYEMRNFTMGKGRD